MLRLEQRRRRLVPMWEWQFAAQSADVVGRGGVFLSVCLPPCSPLFCQVQDLLLTCLHQFLEQAVPADAVCYSVLPDLCFDTQIFHVALADILISQLGANLGSFSGK